MAEQQTPEIPGPVDLSRADSAANWLMWLGGAGVVTGLVFPGLREQFAFSWLVSFMFFLSLGLGGLFLVIVHHLFDASWSLPLRRINEHLAGLLPTLALMWIGVAISTGYLYDWMSLDPDLDHALHSKLPLFTKPGFYIASLACLAVWIVLSLGLRKWSLLQDQTGDARCTIMMRRYSYVGIFLFAFSLTLGAILWMKGLQHAWFSTMYGVYYFAASVWTTLATVYFIVLLLQRQGYLREVVRGDQYYYLGSLFFAFTVFYAYIHFSQYFIIWNANIPEETFWYVQRESGTWWHVGMVLIFGHFFLPFLALLRIDVKLKFAFMLPLCIWAWLMHFFDMNFNVMPVLHPDNYQPHWLDFACFLFIGGVLLRVWLKNFRNHAPYPVKDPRLAEALGVYVEPASEQAKTATGGAK